MTKPLLEQTDRLQIRQIKAAIPRGTVSVTLEVGNEAIQAIGRLTNLKNGYRYFFLCPSCQKPCESLYRRYFSSLRCRTCQGLLYASSLRMDLKTPAFA